MNKRWGNKNQPFDTKCAQLDDLLGVGRSFDMVSRELYVGGRRAKMWVVNGYAKDMLLERAVEKLQEVETLDGISGVDELLRRYITVCDAGTSRDRMQAVTDVFAGKTLLIIDGFSGGILLDAKTFPTRSVQARSSGAATTALWRALWKTPPFCAGASGIRP